MNKSTLILLVSFLSFLSCSQDDNILAENESAVEVNTTIKLEKKSVREEEEVPFNFYESKLQSVSFLVSKTILNDENSLQLILNLLNGLDNPGRIRLHELFNTFNDNNSFVAAFESQYMFYYGSGNFSCGGRPDEEEEPPTLEKGLHSVGVTSFESYLESIVDENCIELYFPNGFNEDELNVDFPIIISSAHPLTTAQTNYAYINGPECKIKKSEITNRSEGNIIIAKPYISDDCFYPNLIKPGFEFFLAK
ncbi:hypothetical protein [uncultured Tenacibaculum sp.]|uniref:hypothetical protein n=1 Tax=uncultured Tenacibaculum sp. TaxID=174713 RepID=UPI00261DE581|nr:hypothetical protein [uncultured Tenacibaculum sp.]